MNNEIYPKKLNDVFLERIREYENPKSGFFDLPIRIFCKHPEHNIPSGLLIPVGKGYRHICPGCGNVIIAHCREISCKVAIFDESKL